MIVNETVAFLTDPAHYTGAQGIPVRILQHLQISVLAVLLSAAIALPVGALIGHVRRGEAVVVNLANALRALPTLGLLFLLVTITADLSTTPLVVSLAVLAVPPVLLSTIAGIAGVDVGVVDGARCTGMNERQVLLQVELPVALPVIAAGIRSAALQVVATAPIAALVAQGTLGSLIIDGLAQRDYPEMVAGALLVAVLAVVVEVLLLLLQRAVVPRGVRTAQARTTA